MKDDDIKYGSTLLIEITPHRLRHMARALELAEEMAVTTGATAHVELKPGIWLKKEPDTDLSKRTSFETKQGGAV